MLLVVQSNLKRKFSVKAVLHAGVLTFSSCSPLSTITVADPKGRPPAVEQRQGKFPRERPDQGSHAYPHVAEVWDLREFYVDSPNVILLSPLSESQHLIPVAPSPASLPGC